MNNLKRYRELEIELLACFNDQQVQEGFTISDDSDEIYQALNTNDELFINWLRDCQLDEAYELMELEANRDIQNENI